MEISIEVLEKTDCFSDIDMHLADFLSRAGGEQTPLFNLTVRMLSSRLAAGDVCLSLDEIAGKSLSYFFGDDEYGLNRKICFPEKKIIIESLNRSSAVGHDNDYLPLILDSHDRLYFHKYYTFENLLASHVNTLASLKDIPEYADAIKNTFSVLFPRIPGETDWQSVAAYSALSGGITVISGGPGTGKTSTVVKILALVAESGLKSGREYLISLAAPTGKAAARLRESVNNSLLRLPVSDEVRKLIPGETYTVHRLLGSVRNSHEFRHNINNPLPHDVVVVDECSMGDMALMCRLVQSVKPGARLILLGDKDQLSSVEGGAVFGDLCGPGGGVYSDSFKENADSLFGITLPETVPGLPPAGRMHDALVVLRKSYRFSGKSGIGLLAGLIRKGDAAGALEILKDDSYPDVKSVRISKPENIGDLYRDSVSQIISLSSKTAVETVADIISGFSVLTAVRKGPFGAEGMNRIAENALFKSGLINPAGKFYHGRPVMISRNDYSLSLFNGDIGITRISGNPDGGVEVVFPGNDGESLSVHPSRLPEHETAFAMTIHKSQGSEFDNVLVVMPDKWNMVMTRELLYTAVTRARHGVVIAADEDILREMILTPTRRMSGLKWKLWDTI